MGKFWKSPDVEKWFNLEHVVMFKIIERPSDGRAEVIAILAGCDFSEVVARDFVSGAVAREWMDNVLRDIDG